MSIRYGIFIFSGERRHRMQTLLYTLTPPMKGISVHVFEFDLEGRGGRVGSVPIFWGRQAFARSGLPSPFVSPLWTPLKVLNGTARRQL